MKVEKKFYQSKKFWAVFSGVAVVLGRELLGLDEVTINKLVALVSMYIVGQGVADIGKNAQ
jgi:hypothetical protein